MERMCTVCMYRRILCKEVNALNKVFEAIASWWEWMVSIAMNFQFKDAVDIIIVAFLIYGVVKLVRETRAGQLVKGLFLLVILFIISSYFNLVMVSRVLAYFFQFAFVAILIVFQPEIRKALEQVGRNNVGQSIAAVVTGRDRSYDRAQIRKAINAVVDGVGILQQLKMGALIVFERKTKLGDIIETGTQINCEPSGQIVGNIFFNKAPLHDGAMIIRDGMIHAAGCILPLTKNTPHLPSDLGTRHRAALGVSEESDAVVVVVSEETGQISVAVNGVLARRFTRDTLRDVLEGYLIPQEEASTVRRKFDVLKGKRTVKK